MAEYDFIVVGAGSSGCVVASRLSEDPDVTVLLLEAGPSDQDHPDIYDPTKKYALRTSTVDWNFKTEPQKHAYQGYKGDGVALWPRGKVLGGSSSINHMMYVRGDSADYDSWESAGAAGWSWKDVLPYMLKLENCQGSRYAHYPFRNHTGPVSVKNGNDMTEATAALFGAGVELGYQEIDTNRGKSIGFGAIELNIDSSGRRSNTVKAYLQPSQNRSNLTVVTDAHVLKINFTDLRAVGISYLLNGEKEEVSAKKEIVISSGVVGSPQILMLSGIGPKTHLDDIGIHCVTDLQVGENLQDHMFLELKATMQQAERIGCNYFDSLANIKFGIQSEENWPDAQLLIAPSLFLSGTDPEQGYVSAQLKSSRFYPYFGFDLPLKERETKTGISIHLTPGHPKSRGYLRLRSSDPLTPPMIQPNYLQDPRDLDVFCEAIRTVDKLIKTKAMSKMGSQLLTLKMPDIVEDEFSDENLGEYVRHFAYTSYHPVGTCKMGAYDDESAVVDPQLRVRGVKCLRVIDASIMPHLTSGNTNVPSMMIGEKGADLIKQDLYK